MDKFIQKLAAEKHTGYIEVFTKDNKTIGILSLKDGEIAGLLVIPDSGPSSFFDAAAVPALLEEVMRQGAVFDVYRSLSEPMMVRKEDAPGPEERSKEKPEEPVIPEEPVVELHTPEPGKGKTVTLLEKQRQDEPEDSEVESNGRGDLLLAVQNVFNKIEKFADGSLQRGGFIRAFKRACIERSETYPFLDPFEGLFDYSNGKVRLDPDVALEDFVVGVADCLNLTLSLLQKELPKNIGLPPNLKSDIEGSFRHYQEIIKRSGLQFVVPTSFR